MTSLLLLSPAKAILLAAHFTAHADIERLSHLAGQRASVLHKELLLRILLTFLPETTEPSVYVGFLRDLANNALAEQHNEPLDITPVASLSEDEALKKVKKLHLLQLSSPSIPTESQDSLLSGFLIQRVYRIDRETGPMSRLPDLLIPFLNYDPAIRLWFSSTVLPYFRRNYEYYTPTDPLYSLYDFQNLPDRTAVSYLVSQTGNSETNTHLIGRDLRGLVGPWLQDQTRWRIREQGEEESIAFVSSGVYCPGWEQVLQWLISQPSGSNLVAVAAIDQWDGPGNINIDLVEGDCTLTEAQQEYLKYTYARAGLASVYSISEATVAALGNAYIAISKHSLLLGYGHTPTIDEAAAGLLDTSKLDVKLLATGRAAAHMRNDLLHDNNPLTSPTPPAISLLLTLITSAFICTRLGCSMTVKRAGDLVILQDRRDQEAEVKQLIRAALAQASGDQDRYWTRVRQEILWLRSWTHTDDSLDTTSVGIGVLGAVPKEFIESQILKTLLSKSCFNLARTIYESGPDRPLPPDVVQGIVYESSLSAFDNATNPNRSRGGLKKCDEIIHSFPRTMDSTHPLTKRVEALLRCTHALSDYRLVLRQGEPFSPVLLRVHSDPISIIEKVLEQNPKAYTRLQEFLEMASNMVHAGIGSSPKPGEEGSTPDGGFVDGEQLAIAEKRIVAMCIEAALREDDFETAYSFVVSRLDASWSDRWSWNAALKAGQYIRSERTLQPTHLGTASGNLEIRHLEQRIECLATALRVAPASHLQEILKTFRRCEEQLDSAIKEETAGQRAWEAPGQVPGAFQEPSAPFSKSSVPRSMAATAAAQRTEDAPMSLFDLSRATARMASRNLTRFSALPSVEGLKSSNTMMGYEASLTFSETIDQAPQQQQTRKRDQFREAATGTLVSSVGWLIGANSSK